MHRGTRLGDRYRLIDQLGAGGMAVVWRGYDEVLQRGVAVKLIAPWSAADRTTRHRLRAEARAAASLSYPHIASVFDYGEVAGRRRQPPAPFVVMELVCGESMSHRLTGPEALAWPEAVATCAQVAGALAFAHEHGVVHRDVTPGNVMVCEAGAKVVDFGISAMMGERDHGVGGRLMGTPAYLAPERLGSHEVDAAVDAAVDVYGVGLLLYRSLSGRLPWPAQTVPQLLKARRESDPLPLGGLPGVPDEVIDICHQCLARDPRRRPRSLEVAYALAGTVGITLPTPTRVLPVGRASIEVSRPSRTGAVTHAPAAAFGSDRTRYVWPQPPRPVRVESCRLPRTETLGPADVARTLVRPARTGRRGGRVLAVLGVLLGATVAVVFAPAAVGPPHVLTGSRSSVGPAPTCPGGVSARDGCEPTVPVGKGGGREPGAGEGDRAGPARRGSSAERGGPAGRGGLAGRSAERGDRDGARGRRGS